MTIIELILTIAGGIALEENHKAHQETMEEVKNTNRLLCEGILSILDNTITGNSVENLKAVRAEIQDFLIRR